MAEYTENYNLEKQQGNDYINIEGINNNFDVIDSEISKLETDKADKTDIPTEYIHPDDADTRHVTDLEKAKWNNKVDQSTMSHQVLSASGWGGATQPFSYSLPVEGATSTNVIEILPRDTLTTEQAESMADAIIASGSQTTNRITLKAYGDIPSIDLPITIIVRRDL